MAGMTMANAADFVGQALGTTDWKPVDQAKIEDFANCSNDHQWIHVDPERAARESPYGATIAHGMLTLSLAVTWLMELRTTPADAAAVLNYGFDKVRFLTPVVSGRRVRGHVRMLEAEPKKGGRLLLKQELTVEIEGEDKPALMAELLVMALPAQT